MSVRPDERLQSIEDLSLYPQKISKACTVGLVIDSTSAYFDQSKIKYVKKIKLVDDTFNTSKYSPHQKFPYLTVFFFSPKIEDLPNPRFIGDLIYLRRFSFGKYNQSFQGHYIQHNYCSWALVNGEASQIQEYQTSRGVEMNLSDEEKYPQLADRIRQLRKFGRSYLSTTSVVTILPTGIVPKDFDLIVQVIKNTEEGFKLSNGRQQLLLGNVPSFAAEGSIAKLRSIAKLVNQGKYSNVVPNNFTSLISLRQWTYDAQKFTKSNNAMDIQDDGDIYTTLAQLNTLPLNECENKKYYVKVEVASASATEFTNALKFYDQNKNALIDTPRKGAVPVYKFNFVTFDDSLSKGNKFSEIWIFSYDGNGADFVDRVKLQDLNEFSSYTEESKYFSKRIEDILSAPFVKMTVEVLSDGKGNRILRALSVN